MHEVGPRPDGTETSRRSPGGAKTAGQNGTRVRRRWIAVAGAAVVVLIVGTIAMATRDTDDARAESRARSAPAPVKNSPSRHASPPGDGPPYVAVPRFSTPSARDTAFVADVAPFSTWPSGTESYGVMSSAPGGGDISDFRKAVVEDAQAVCAALTAGTDMNDVPDTVGLALTDPIDQAGFIVEAVTFYCPDRMAAVTDGVYSEPVPTGQSEDCPTADALEVTTSVGKESGDDLIHTSPYRVEVRNTSSYTVRAQLEQRWFADGFADDGVWGTFGDVTADPVVTVEAGDTFTYEGEQSGIYHWKRTDVRVRPGQLVFFGCGYQPGPGAVGAD